MKRDSDFIDGRWLPPWDPGSSANFGFVSDERLARLLRIAEANLFIDPSTTLIKLRQFAEVLTRKAAPRFGVYPGPDETQADLLQRLRGPKGPGTDVLEGLHRLRKLGNQAVHELGGTLGTARTSLRQSQDLAYWFESELEGRRLRRPKFETPRDPREIFAKASRELAAARVEGQQHAEAAMQSQAEAEWAQREASERARELEEANADRRRLEEEAQTWKILAEEQEVAHSPARLAHRIESLRKDLRALEGREEAPGLPDWAAAVAAGDEPPFEMPDEVLQDLRTLGPLLKLPRLQAPRVKVESTGNLTASARVPLTVHSTIRNPDNLAPAARSGAVWSDEQGQEFLIPGRLRAALDDLESGPPQQEAGESAAEATRRRKLWWGRLRRELEAHGVELKGYLGDTDAVVVDRLIPRLIVGDDGHFEVRFSADSLSEEQMTQLVDGSRTVPGDVTLRHRSADGVLHRRSVYLSPLGRRAVHRAKKVRRMGQQAGPLLRDAVETVFDDELFDLSEYSDRVVGIGRPVYRVSRSFLDQNDEFRFEIQPSPGSIDASEVELSPSEQAELAALLKRASQAGQSYVRFKSDWVRVPTPERAQELAEKSGAVRTGGVLIIKDNTDALEFVSGDSGLGGRLATTGRPPGLAEGIALMPHQREGLSWLAGHTALVEGASDHGLLADDMGLGKTLQVLSVMSLLEEAGELGPTLIVAPLSLLQNWEQEASRFFPARFKNRVRLGAGVRLPADALRRQDLVLASYETLRSQQLELGRVRWKLMVCDECHRIRNPTAQTTSAVLAMDAERRLGLTGTPVQNSLVDLWSQFDWLAPGVLGDLRAFRKRFSAGLDDEPGALQRLRDIVDPRTLRRLKNQVMADLLPPKFIHRHRLTMDSQQRVLYDRLLNDFRGQRGRAFKILPRLMQVSADPRLVAQAGDSGLGPKLRWLLSMLESIADNGEKVIVFAEWYALQERVAAAIEGAFNMRVDRINGAVEAGLRLAKVEAFGQSPGFGALVLGPKATGVGLNITAANHVVHLTRHWNPALEAQATDRVYRIGQKRPVHVHLPIAVHPHVKTIDEHLDELLLAKAGMAENFLQRLDGLSVAKELEVMMRRLAG